MWRAWWTSWCALPDGSAGARALPTQPYGLRVPLKVAPPCPPKSTSPFT